MRSGAAHCDLQLAVEIRRCPLQHKAGKDDGEEKEEEEEEKEEQEKRRTALIKSNNLHLTGGEKTQQNDSRSGMKCLLFVLVIVFSLCLVGYLKSHDVFTCNHIVAGLLPNGGYQIFLDCGDTMQVEENEAGCKFSKCEKNREN